MNPTTIMRAGAVAASALTATLLAVSAAYAHGSQSGPDHSNRGKQRVDELHMQVNPGMQRMHQLHGQGGPGMQRMHELHMQGRDGLHPMDTHPPRG